MPARDPDAETLGPQGQEITLRGGTVKAFAADLLKNEVVLKVAFYLNAELLKLQTPVSELASKKEIVDLVLRARDARSHERQMTLGEALRSAAPGETPVNVRTVILAETPDLPALEGMYQYVVAGNGLFLRAADPRLEAMLHLAAVDLHGLAMLEPYARLLIPKVPADFLVSVLASARRHLPNEAMFQFLYDGDPAAWRCVMPEAETTPTGVHYQDEPSAIVDLHSHGAADAFFSSTDNTDEQGLRFYVVIGNVDDTLPDLMVRIGVYGHWMDVPADTLFEGVDPFVDLNRVEAVEAVEESTPEEGASAEGETLAVPTDLELAAIGEGLVVEAGPTDSELAAETETT